MKRQLIYALHGLLALVMIVGLSGCGRLVDWADRNFPQGDKRYTPDSVARKNIRTIRIYHNIQTIGLFDVLWLNDEVRGAYVDVVSAKMAMTLEQKADLLHTELSENETSISFYVLESSLSCNNEYFGKLGKSKGIWSIQLLVDGIIYHPTSIKKVRLNPEYLRFLERVWNNRKASYLVQFSARVDGKPIITPETEKIEIIFNTFDRSATGDWWLIDKKNNKDDEYEDYNWN